MVQNPTRREGGNGFDARAGSTGNRPPGTVARMCYRRAITREVKLRQAGGSVSATLPKDMAARLRLEPGDRVLAIGPADDPKHRAQRAHGVRR